MESLQRNLLQWSRLDKEIKEMNDQIKVLRKKRDILQSKICPVIQSEDLNDNIFSIPSLQMNVVFKEQKISESMSYKFLEEKLNAYFDKPEQTQVLLQYLKDNRKQEITHTLKSTIIKE